MRWWLSSKLAATFSSYLIHTDNFTLSSLLVRPKLWKGNQISHYSISMSSDENVRARGGESATGASLDLKAGPSEPLDAPEASVAESNTGKEGVGVQPRNSRSGNLWSAHRQEGFDLGRRAFGKLFNKERKYPRAEVHEARKSHALKSQMSGKGLKRSVTQTQCHGDDEAKEESRASKMRRMGGGAAARYIHGLEGQVMELGVQSGCFVGYWKHAFPMPGKIMETLRQEVEWMEKEVVVHGVRHMQPRQIAYMADSVDLTYTYSRLKLVPQAYTPTVQMIKDHLEKVAYGDKPLEFNCVLLNYYRNGSDHMGWHSDNEPLFGDNPIIGSVSFGADRDFVLRSEADNSMKYLYKLGSGDVLVMSGATQNHFKHCLPKRKTVAGGRINLTFRKIIRKEKVISPSMGLLGPM